MLLQSKKPQGIQVSSATNTKKKHSGHTRPELPLFTLEMTARVRVKHMLALLSVAHSTFYAGIQTGRYPKPDGHDGKFPYWKTSTVRDFLEGV